MTRIKVAVRVRPLSNRELETGSSSVISVENGNTIAITNVKVPEQNAGDSRERVRRFTFDYCLQEDSTQDHIFEAVERVISKSVKRRFHSCVLAYGQSSSGKTHTMMGFPHDPGLIPRLCHRIFGYLQETAVGDEILDFKVKVSYLEIYNEKVRDLLHCESEDSDNTKKFQPLKVREHPKKGPYVQGLSEHPVTDSAGLLEWLDRGNKQRRVAATLTNPQSSRSHSVFSINCDGAKLHLIDLAGSERAGSRCYSTPQFREGANINKSLVALGNVISALAEQTSRQAKIVRRKFVPYRDSVLTWLLKDTLGGNSNTVMVATVSPSSACYNETVNTLRFGQRAKLIVSRPVVNEDPKEKTIRELRAEIARLKDLLKYSQLLPGDPMFQSSDKTSEEIRSYSRESTHGQNITTPVQEIDVSSQIIREEEISDLSKFIEGKNEDANCVNINECCGEHLDENYVNSQTHNSVDTPISENDSAPIVTSNILDKNCKTTEKLVPLISVSSTLKQTKPTKLRRTYSVDHTTFKMENNDLSKFGSAESIPSTGTVLKKSNSLLEKQQSHESIPLVPAKKPNTSSNTTVPLRRRSLNKSNPSLPNSIAKRRSLEENPKKIEKAVATELSNTKTVEAKVNSIRKNTIKPRSQIVAAVTSRLYSKMKKKEAATDTDDLNTYKNELPKELTICTNARARLRELTRKALMAHKRRNGETQTDLFPVLRMKETSTDVSDLKVELAEVKDAETEPDIIDTRDASVDCTFLNQFCDEERRNNWISFTRTCGTQSCEDFDEKRAEKDTAEEESVLPSRGSSNPISFTKYLREVEAPTVEVNDIVPNTPIYTKTVNINISHNYINGNGVNNSVSDDSMPSRNGCFSTPDLISNHNSLEQQAHENLAENCKKTKISYPNMNTLQDHFTAIENVIPASEYISCTIARCTIIPNCTEKIHSFDISEVYAPEVCTTKDFDEVFCTPLPAFNPALTKPKIVEYKDIACYDCIRIEEPLVLKSIVKQCINSFNQSSSSDEEISKSDLPDSLDYHMANNKKVTFSKKDKKNLSNNDRMVKAMSDFLDEATQLMNNLTMAANNLSNHEQFLSDSYEFEVTLKDIRGLKKASRKRRRKTVHAGSVLENKRIEDRGESVFVDTAESSTQCSIDYTIPINKYEILVEDSCRRLEEKVNRIPITEPKVNIINDHHDYSGNLLVDSFSDLGYNPWDLNQPSNDNEIEDSSLESNPITFSDYGSLPRKTHKRHRTPTCSPSAFLRQLTNMRKQIIESSREELLGCANNH